MNPNARIGQVVVDSTNSHFGSVVDVERQNGKLQGLRVLRGRKEHYIEERDIETIGDHGIVLAVEPAPRYRGLRVMERGERIGRVKQAHEDSEGLVSVVVDPGLGHEDLVFANVEDEGDHIEVIR